MITATHLHAMVIHFPIALLMVAFLLEIIAFVSKKEFFKNTSLLLLVLGATGALVAYISGSLAGEGIEEGPLKNPMELHETAALITLVTSMSLAIFRVAIYYFNFEKPWTKWASLIVFVVLFGSVSITGYLGGQLVYKHGAGVELALPDFSNDEGLSN